MNIENQDLFNTFAAVISSHIVEQPSSCYYLHDNEIDFTILKHSIIDKDKNLLYVIRPSGTCLLRCDKYFFPNYYLTCCGDYKTFKYVHFNLATGDAEEITWQQAFKILSKPGKPPLRGSLGRFDYLKLVVDDLRARGYADFLPAYNLDGLRHFAVKDERPSLVSYIDDVMALCA
ncbi:hypothetical protein QUQ27_004515 [Escherichia coli]|nr:hypothetical protein [Escherichia coli]